MDIHDNARLTPRRRADVVHGVLVLGRRRAGVARSFGVTLKTVTKWVRRFQSEGAPGLRDRTSRPHQLFRPSAPSRPRSESGPAAKPAPPDQRSLAIGPWLHHNNHHRAPAGIQAQNPAQG